MVDVRGDVLRPPHGTTPAAVKSNIKSEMINLTKRRNIKNGLCTLSSPIESKSTSERQIARVIFYESQKVLKFRTPENLSPLKLNRMAFP